MALVSCPECGGNVSTDAAACPHCGFPRPAAARVPPPPSPPGPYGPHGPYGPPPPPAGGGISARTLIIGGLAVAVLLVGLFVLSLYRVMRQVDRVTRPEELVDFVDSVERSTPAPVPAPSTSVPSTGRAPNWQMPPAPASGPDGAYELSALDEQPALLNREEIAAVLTRNYPPLLRDAGVAGTVNLRMRIGEDGTVDPASIEVIDTSHEAFSDAAVRIAQRFRFKPGRYGGRAVPVWVSLPINFEIKS